MPRRLAKGLQSAVILGALALLLVWPTAFYLRIAWEIFMSAWTVID